MKFLADGSRINQVETICGYEPLVAVDFKNKKKTIVKETWGQYWIFDAEEQFSSYCMMMFGWQPVALTDEEYKEIVQHGRLSLYRNRRQTIHNAIRAMIPK